MHTYHFTIGKNTKGEYYLKFIASNNQIIIWSEGYSTKESALHAIDLVKTNAAGSLIYQEEG